MDQAFTDNFRIVVADFVGKVLKVRTIRNRARALSENKRSRRVHMEWDSHESNLCRNWWTMYTAPWRIRAKAAEISVQPQIIGYEIRANRGLFSNLEIFACRREVVE
jgi:hypothetical protein